MENSHTFLENLALVLCTAAVTSFAALTPRMAEEEDPDNLFRTMEHIAVMLPGLVSPFRCEST